MVKVFLSQDKNNLKSHVITISVAFPDCEAWSPYKFTNWRVRLITQSSGGGSQQKSLKCSVLGVALDREQRLPLYQAQAVTRVPLPSFPLSRLHVFLQMRFLPLDLACPCCRLCDCQWSGTVWFSHPVWTRFFCTICPPFFKMISSVLTV